MLRDEEVVAADSSDEGLPVPLSFPVRLEILPQMDGIGKDHPSLLLTLGPWIAGHDIAAHALQRAVPVVDEAADFPFKGVYSGIIGDERHTEPPSVMNGDI